MARLAYIVALLALLGQATGCSAFAAAAEAPCAQPCPGDDTDGNCPPNCPACACCVHLPPITLVRAAPLVTVAVRLVRFHVAASFPASAEPADILHVPKTALA